MFHRAGCGSCAAGASGWERMARPAMFEGDVIGGRNYLLVDDFVGQGDTLANLRGSNNPASVVKDKSGGPKHSATTSVASPKAKDDISFVSRMLTPSERAFLRQDLKSTIEIARKVKIA